MEKISGMITAEQDISGEMSVGAIETTEATTTDDITYYGESLTTTLDTVGEKVAANKKSIDDLKKSVSDGKNLVATAITEKGVATEGTDSFNTMAENIKSIPSGGTSNAVMVECLIKTTVQHEGVTD